MFSSGQIESKVWILNELAKIDPDFLYQGFVIAGSWYGTLGMMLKYKVPTILVTMVDLDPRCEVFVNNMLYNDGAMKAITQNMFEYRYIENVIINTSCEHIEDVNGWVKLLPQNRIVVLQSNNYDTDDGHINCVKSKEEFVTQSGLKEITFVGELELPMYTRYMIIGKT